MAYYKHVGIEKNKIFNTITIKNMKHYKFD